ncbi:MAG: heparinase II/III family protein [Planctomycetes bacterium]|nr:heparinase II/III family protein [Planctomycetota bacterium]
MLPIPINEAEAVFQRFFDPYRCDIDQWGFRSDPLAGSRAYQQFHASVIEWETGCGLVGFLAKDLEVDAGGYDRLILCCTLPTTTRVAVRAVVDGRERVVIDGVPGENNSAEISGPVGGRFIHRIAIELTDTGGQPGNVQLFWLGLASDTRLRAMSERPNPYRGSWDDLLVPRGKEGPLEPALGLFFDGSDLDRLRQRLSRRPYRTVLDRWRAQVKDYAAKEPWRGVGVWPNHPKPRCYRFRSPEHIDLLAMRLCAFVGLIDNDPELCRTALDHALALAHCDKWQPEFLATIAGSAWEQRAFYEYRYAQGAIYAWDWAGACLTPAGRHVLAQAISTKALPWILQTLMRHPYVRGCNQGAYFAWGAILCELALARLYPHATELLDAAVKALDETVNRYFGPDGGAFEGPGYVSSTVGHALAAYALVARHRRVGLETVAPPVLKQVPRYLAAMASTVAPIGAAIPVADGGGAGVSLYPDGFGLLATLTGDESVRALLAGILEEEECRDYTSTPGILMSLIFGPDELPAPAVRPPIFHRLEHTGLLCSCRMTKEGPVRLQLVGGPAHSGHTHEDRGSFILEAFGEEIAIDRGQMGYEDPRCLTIKSACYHNLLIPETRDRRPARQINPCPAATIPDGSGNEKILRCSIDVSPAWGVAVQRCVRRIESDRPELFIVIDEADLPEAGRVAFHLHSRFPWTQTGRTWITCGRRARLSVTPDWQAEEASAGEDFIDGAKLPVYHLILVTPASERHLLRTRMELEVVIGA